MNKLKKKNHMIMLIDAEIQHPFLWYLLFTRPKIIFNSFFRVLILSEWRHVKGTGILLEQKLKLPSLPAWNMCTLHLWQGASFENTNGVIRGYQKEDTRGLVSLCLSILLVFKIPGEICGDNQNRNVYWRQPCP